MWYKVMEDVYPRDIYRYDLINKLISTFNLEWYLEIGSANRTCFNKVECPHKVGIDPAYLTYERPSWAVYQITSDEFFKRQTGRYDICFIDGLHLYEQVIKDIVNTWNVLNVGGFILIHDCLPYSQTAAERHRPENYGGAWMGDCYRAIVWFRDTYPDIYCKTLYVDCGIGLIYKDREVKLSVEGNSLSYLDLDYSWLTHNINRIGFSMVSELDTLITTIKEKKWALENLVLS
jgi:hypothetical protein